jgi:hypothetical protein
LHPFDYTFKEYDLEQCVRYQRFLIFRMNFMKWDVDEEEAKRRVKEYDEFTLWLWNNKDKK